MAGHDSRNLEIVGKTWVVVHSPPGVPAGTKLLAGDVLPFWTEKPGQIAPDSREHYRLESDNGDIFSAFAEADPGCTEDDPFEIHLDKEET